MASTTPGAAGRIREMLRSAGEKPYTLEEMEKWDKLVRNFDLNKASTRELAEAIEENFRPDKWNCRDWLVWELQRLGALAEKLHVGRLERDERLYEQEREHEEGLQAMSTRIHSMQELVLTHERELTQCEAMLARTEAGDAKVAAAAEPEASLTAQGTDEQAEPSACAAPALPLATLAPTQIALAPTRAAPVLAPAVAVTVLAPEQPAGAPATQWDGYPPAAAASEGSAPAAPAAPAPVAEPTLAPPPLPASPAVGAEAADAVRPAPGLEDQRTERPWDATATVLAPVPVPVPVPVPAQVPAAVPAPAPTALQGPPPPPVPEAAEEQALTARTAAQGAMCRPPPLPPPLPQEGFSGDAALQPYGDAALQLYEPALPPLANRGRWQMARAARQRNCATTEADEGEETLRPCENSMPVPSTPQVPAVHEGSQVESDEENPWAEIA